MKHLKYLNKFILKYKYRLILGIVFIVISNIFLVTSPRIVGFAIDMVVNNIAHFSLFSDFELKADLFSNFYLGLLLFGAVYLLVSLFSGLFSFFTRQTIIVMSRLVEYDLRNIIYQHYQELDWGFYKRNNTGDLMSRITEDVNRVRMYLGPAIMYSINLVVLCILVIGTMLSINPKLTAIVLLPLPLLSISIYYVNNLINKGSEEIQAKMSDLTTHAQEVYSGIRVVKAYVREYQMLKYFTNESDEYKDKSLKLARIEALFFPLMLVLIGLSIVFTIYFGGIEVYNGSVTPGNIAEFLIYVTMLTWPVTAIGWVASIIQRAAASQKRINEFLQMKPDIVNNSEEEFFLEGQVEFDHVTFTYPDTGIKALIEISFKLEKGQKMAIIGRTGSGKSTIAELLMRMHDVKEGEIRIDGENIKQINLGELRRQIGFVPQDVFLFSDTIMNNIQFGSERIEPEKSVVAAKQAIIHNEIENLSKKYDTMIGERGVTLSGGQKQRISIARALVKNPNMLILDDCLSAVDAHTEKAIQKELDILMKDKTTIIITHRIFTLLQFDQIIVLEDGRIIEKGTHDELIALKGLYQELFEKQQLEDKNFA
ncbi:MAG: ABC transporter ATP-binding protein [Bacteroidia bacterium]|nr:ABC transporter ATP-binding protein [Bacteroidia bacterium]